MFLENSLTQKERSGWVEAICGSMFSGKTEELIRRLKRAQIARQKVEIFKPQVDTRYSEDEIVSHDSKSIRSTVIDTAGQLVLLADQVDVVGIDEAQFFDDDIIVSVNKLANAGVRVIVAGLDMDFKGRPFGPMPGLMAIAEFVTKVHAICQQCGNLAHYSFRKSTEKQKVILGSQEMYQPLCRNCFNQ
ncbi:MAG: thymidine kinase [Flavobacteriales bacterium]|jgi:thymidine kinase